MIGKRKARMTTFRDTRINEGKDCMSEGHHLRIALWRVHGQA